MTIKLNSINYPLKPHSELVNNQKSEKMFKKIEESNFFEFDYDIETTNKLKNVIKNEILTTSVGRKVFKKLMEGSEIKLKEHKKGEIFFDPSHRSIYINPKVKFYYFAQDESGDTYYQKGTIGEILLHECLHALHFQQRESGYLDIPEEGLFAEMDNKEEQMTICGMPDTQASEPLPLCENAYLSEQNKPNRINHRSIQLAENETISNSEMAYFGANKSLRESLKINPNLIDEPGSIHHKKWAKKLGGKKITPLSAAVNAGRKDILHLLLNNGADPSAPDDMGGALFAALAANKFELFRELLAHTNCQIIPSLKNPEGNSLIAEFCKATRKYDYDDTTASKFWNEVAASFLKIIDPKETAVSQLIKHKGSAHLLKAIGEERFVDENGNTIIMRTIIEEDINYFRYLLGKCSFDLEARNHQDETALKLALKQTNEEISSEMIFRLRHFGAQIHSDLQAQVDALLDPQRNYRWQRYKIF